MSVAELEEAQRGVVDAPECVVVDDDALDATVGRERTGLRLDLLRRKDPRTGRREGSRFSSSR